MLFVVKTCLHILTMYLITLQIQKWNIRSLNLKSAILIRTCGENTDKHSFMSIGVQTFMPLFNYAKKTY